MLPLQIIFNTLTGTIFIVYWGMAFAILYHLTRFGVGVQPKKFAIIFLFGSIVFSMAAIIFFMEIDINSFMSS